MHHPGAKTAGGPDVETTAAVADGDSPELAEQPKSTTMAADESRVSGERVGTVNYQPVRAPLPGSPWFSSSSIWTRPV
ncbi:hypothetical protein GGTG_07161 [Gaeumannomyces tritici R3-111a-1]|uniref:Uncharacterized protein n=1 Tax=Gaeumannomyces tritici (strain R3-111a-1) TaxID=644352 RepID=J3P0W5_GAET3|nr:hypothetical protein GGTG_07161 [Gaeumannomyces tritici R3-111a-1]EJT77249.1 hypothetical protein GGTG_07161 [Gaeumannomyces tritici R3-111a-1]